MNARTTDFLNSRFALHWQLNLTFFFGLVQLHQPQSVSHWTFLCFNCFILIFNVFFSLAHTLNVLKAKLASCKCQRMSSADCHTRHIDGVSFFSWVFFFSENKAQTCTHMFSLNHRKLHCGDLQWFPFWASLITRSITAWNVVPLPNVALFSTETKVVHGMGCASQLKGLDFSATLGWFAKLFPGNGTKCEGDCVRRGRWKCTFCFSGTQLNPLILSLSRVMCQTGDEKLHYEVETYNFKLLWQEDSDSEWEWLWRLTTDFFPCMWLWNS